MPSRCNTISFNVFKAPGMTLTVRLDDALEGALARYCTEHGVSKSLVVQESLAVYLVDRAGAAPAQAGAAPARESGNLRAFKAAGLIGALSQGAGADKAAVRKRAVERLSAGSARRSPR